MQYRQGKLRELVRAVGQTGGTWTETVLFEFGTYRTEGTPDSPLAFDQAGNIYGSAVGGPQGTSVLFELTPGASGWAYSELYAGIGQRWESPWIGRAISTVR